MSGEIDDMEFISFAEAASLVGLTPEALRAANRRKLLRAKKIGRNWATTRRWLFEWFDNRNPRGNPNLLRG